MNIRTDLQDSAVLYAGEIIVNIRHMIMKEYNLYLIDDERIVFITNVA